MLVVVCVCESDLWIRHNGFLFFFLDHFQSQKSNRTNLVVWYFVVGGVVLSLRNFTCESDVVDSQYFYFVLLSEQIFGYCLFSPEEQDDKSKLKKKPQKNGKQFLFRKNSG